MKLFLILLAALAVFMCTERGWNIQTTGEFTGVSVTIHCVGYQASPEVCLQAAIDGWSTSNE